MSRAIALAERRQTGWSFRHRCFGYGGFDCLKQRLKEFPHEKMRRSGCAIFFRRAYWPGSGTTSRPCERDQARANSAPNKRITEETYSQIMMIARDPAAPKLVATERAPDIRSFRICWR
jgi:hypothetical protein